MLSNINNECFVFDGGMSSEIESVSPQSATAIQNSPLWSAQLLIDNADVVRSVHSRFLQAGAQIIETNTYHANFCAFQKLGYDQSKALDYIGLGVKLARETVNQYINEAKDVSQKNILVAGSIGPYGTTLCDASEYSGHYMGTTDPKTILDYHIQQADAILCTQGVDLLSWDTIPSLKEAEYILQTLDNLKSKYGTVNATVSFSCKSNTETCAGDLYSNAYQLLATSQFPIKAVGINCTHPSHVTPLLESSNQHYMQYKLPIIVYPNSGESYDKEHGWHFARGQQQTDWNPLIPDWHKLGCRIFGGCCRVYSRDIAAIAGAVKLL